MNTGTANGTRIVAMGHYQPAKILTNDDLAATMDTSDEWIRDRVGVATRHIAADTETVADMATAAAQHALANTTLTAADIDLIVVATCTSVDRVPNVATRVAHQLGITAPGAYDINTACSGFCYGLATADHAIRAGTARNAIVIGAEKLSDFIDWTDRSTAIIFGDAAGAAILTATDHTSIGVGPVIWGSDPAKGDAVRIEGWQPHIEQEGQAVFRWATTELAAVALQACERAGVAPQDIAAFVGHQANTRILDGIAKRLKLPNAVIVKDIVESGNTSSASIPLALSKLVATGDIPPGSPVLIFGFGGGLTYAGQVIRHP